MHRRRITLLGFALVVAATVDLVGAARVESEHEPTLEKLLVGANRQAICDKGDGIVHCRGYTPTFADCGEAIRKLGETSYLCRVVYPRGGPSTRVVCAALHESRHPIGLVDGKITTIFRVGVSESPASVCRR